MLLLLQLLILQLLLMQLLKFMLLLLLILLMLRLLELILCCCWCRFYWCSASSSMKQEPWFISPITPSPSLHSQDENLHSPSLTITHYSDFFITSFSSITILSRTAELYLPSSRFAPVSIMHAFMHLLTSPSVRQTVIHAFEFPFELSLKPFLVKGVWWLPLC